MSTIGEGLARFEEEWVAEQPLTPRTAYRRTLRLLRMYLDGAGASLEAPLDRLGPDDLRGFVRWHRAHDLADDDEGSRKVAVHVARLGAFLVTIGGRPDLAVDRADLRAVVSGEDTA